MSKLKPMKYLLIAAFFCFAMTAEKASAQLDLNNLKLNDLFGKVMYVKKGFAPKFFLGRTPIQKISKVEEILGLKQSDEINKLFRTFKTGRLIYKVAAYTAGALALYGTIKKLDQAAQKQNYQGALATALGSAASGLIVKFVTKGASYKAVQLFSGVVVKRIEDIFSIAPASNTLGVGLYVKLN